jgi:signal transduction histidine kinase
VRGVAEAYGGRVRVETSAEAGTTFIVELPGDARPAQST